ncbi:MAG: hypothetical protein SOU05_01695 [Atopobium sp.]|uniref:hypothetical protein n=1 Tax=Atopobium sp. TaxID=1872650 RepID=UPI002A7583D8|nr:hypothetical protein [Atopobium sp.]MDY2788106.1 hypothetical protein [Atopobium sp.]
MKDKVIHIGTRAASILTALLVLIFFTRIVPASDGVRWFIWNCFVVAISVEALVNPNAPQKQKTGAIVALCVSLLLTSLLLCMS